MEPQEEQLVIRIASRKVWAAHLHQPPNMIGTSISMFDNQYRNKQNILHQGPNFITEVLLSTTLKTK